MVGRYDHRVTGQSRRIALSKTCFHIHYLLLPYLLAVHIIAIYPTAAVIGPDICTIRNRRKRGIAVVFMMSLMRLSFTNGFLPQQFACVTIQTYQIKLVNMSRCFAASSSSAPSGIVLFRFGSRSRCFLFVGFNRGLKDDSIAPDNWRSIRSVTG